MRTLALRASIWRKVSWRVEYFVDRHKGARNATHTAVELVSDFLASGSMDGTTHFRSSHRCASSGYEPHRCRAYFRVQSFVESCCTADARTLRMSTWTGTEQIRLERFLACLTAALFEKAWTTDRRQAVRAQYAGCALECQRKQGVSPETYVHCKACVPYHEHQNQPLAAIPASASLSSPLRAGFEYAGRFFPPPKSASGGNSCICFLILSLTCWLWICWSLFSLRFSCQQSEDVDGSFRDLTPLLSDAVDVLLWQTIIAIYASLVIFILFVYSFCAPRAAVTLDTGQV